MESKGHQLGDGSIITIISKVDSLFFLSRNSSSKFLPFLFSFFLFLSLVLLDQKKNVVIIFKMKVIIIFVCQKISKRWRERKKRERKEERGKVTPFLDRNKLIPNQAN